MERFCPCVCVVFEFLHVFVGLEICSLLSTLGNSSLYFVIVPVGCFLEFCSWKVMFL